MDTNTLSLTLINKHTTKCLPLLSIHCFWQRCSLLPPPLPSCPQQDESPRPWRRREEAQDVQYVCEAATVWSHQTHSCSGRVMWQDIHDYWNTPWGHCMHKLLAQHNYFAWECCLANCCIHRLLRPVHSHQTRNIYHKGDQHARAAAAKQSCNSWPPFFSQSWWH